MSARLQETIMIEMVLLKSDLSVDLDAAACERTQQVVEQRPEKRWQLTQDRVEHRDVNHSLTEHPTQIQSKLNAIIR